MKILKRLIGMKVDVDSVDISGESRRYIGKLSAFDKQGIFFDTVKVKGKYDSYGKHKNLYMPLSSIASICEYEEESE